MNDWCLLREFIDHRSEAAFGKLLDKHINMVYSVCRREIGNEQSAEDATLAVFLLLSDKARFLSNQVTISGWLFRAARLVSRNAVRRQLHQERIISEAIRNMEDFGSNNANWKSVEPFINHALSKLNSAERDAVLLRYFDGLSLREVGDELGISENTAAKRVSRAIEKLRALLVNKNGALTSTTLASLIQSHAADAAPSACRVQILETLHSNLAGHPVTQIGILNLAHIQRGVYFAMQATKYKYLIVAAILLLFGSVVIPVVVHMRQGSAVLPSKISVTIIDATASSLSPDDPDAIVRKEIESDILTDQTGWVQGSWEAHPWDSPTRVIVEGDNSRHTPSNTYYQFWNNTNQTVAGMAPNHLQKVQINSFQLNGDKAVVGATIQSESGPGAPEQSTWQKINGQWMDVGPDTMPFVSSRPH